MRWLQLRGSWRAGAACGAPGCRKSTPGPRPASASRCEGQPVCSVRNYADICQRSTPVKIGLQAVVHGMMGLSQHAKQKLPRHFEKQAEMQAEGDHQ